MAAQAVKTPWLGFALLQEPGVVCLLWINVEQSLILNAASLPRMPHLFAAEQPRHLSIGQEQRPRPLPFRRISRSLPPPP